MLWLQIVITDCVASVLKKTCLRPKDIDILIINCSLFSPTPSLCSMVINEFQMRSDILSYNLSGMVRSRVHMSAPFTLVQYITEIKEEINCCSVSYVVVLMTLNCSCSPILL